jgi:hypothetical protein
MDAAGGDATVPDAGMDDRDGGGGMDAAAADASMSADDAGGMVDAGGEPIDAHRPADAAPVDAPIPPEDAPRPDGGMCNRLAENGDAIGTVCSGRGDCPEGYTCHALHGIIVTYSCQILCTRDCECPPAHVCEEHRDKAGTWTACTPVP